MTDDVSMKPYLLRFAIAYVVVNIVANVLVHVFSLKSGAGLSGGMLIIAAVYPANKFAEDHLRIFSKNEFWRMLGGSLAVDMLLQALLAFLVMPQLAKSGLFLGALVFASLLHAALIAFVYSDWMMKRIVQGHEKKLVKARNK